MPCTDTSNNVRIPIHISRVGTFRQTVISKYEIANKKKRYSMHIRVKLHQNRRAQC